MKQSGPKATLQLSCFRCTYERSEKYAIQGDSGHRVSCTHPEATKHHIGDTNWSTPVWCPFLKNLPGYTSEEARQLAAGWVAQLVNPTAHDHLEGSDVLRLANGFEQAKEAERLRIAKQLRDWAAQYLKAGEDRIADALSKKADELEWKPR